MLKICICACSEYLFLRKLCHYDDHPTHKINQEKVRRLSPNEIYFAIIVHYYGTVMKSFARIWPLTFYLVHL